MGVRREVAADGVDLLSSRSRQSAARGQPRGSPAAPEEMQLIRPDGSFLILLASLSRDQGADAAFALAAARFAHFLGWCRVLWIRNVSKEGREIRLSLASDP